MKQNSFDYGSPENLLRCHIVSVGKRRDGGTKYWCLNHKADATAKYGKKAKACRYSNIEPIKKSDIFNLNIQNYPGGVSLWGAVPPVYDTTKLPLDKGVHVHARIDSREEKIIDKTYRQVNILNENSDVYVISELDAIYYMTSTVFGFGLKLILCTKCGYPHLDKDWFSIHPHQSHLCAGCGKNFRDKEIAIGNPISRVKSLPPAKQTKTKESKKKLRIRQKDYPGGIQIWGSNPAILWTSKKYQDKGIHIHAFKDDLDCPIIDDTFGLVEIDGIVLNEDQIRTYMAQMSLPHISDRIRSITCLECGHENFDINSDAYEPKTNKFCSHCGSTVKPDGRLRKVIANPIILTLKKLEGFSSNPVQKHDVGLIPETL